MPHVTEHTPKVSTRSVKPYACESSREKRQQDRRPDRQKDRQTDGQTDRQTQRRIVQNHFSRRFGGCTSQIRSYLEVDFLHDANTSIDMEVKYHPSGNMKFNNLGIFQSLKLRMLMRKILPLSLKLHLIPNTVGCNGLNGAVGSIDTPNKFIASTVSQLMSTRRAEPISFTTF